MNILFTGHNGFLGRELIPLLSQDFRLTTYIGNLLDFQNLSRFIDKNAVTHVIHAAARGGRRIKTDNSDVLLNNFLAAQNIFNLGVPTLTFCSGKIYNYEYSIDCAKEGEFPNGFPKDYYGQSKYFAYMLAKDYKHVTFFRYFNVFGNQESDERFIKSNAHRATQGDSLIIHKDIMMDFFYVRDSLPLIAKWLSNQEFVKEVNLVYREKYTLLSLAKLIKKILKSNSRIEILDTEKGKNYFADGSLLSELNFDFLGLEHGIEESFSKK